MRSERTRMSSERGRGQDRHVARSGERDCRQLLSAPAPHAGGNANDGSSFSLPRGRRPRRFWSEARGALRVVVARGIRWRFGGAFACRRKRRRGETVCCVQCTTYRGTRRVYYILIIYTFSILIIVHNATVRQRADGPARGRAAARGRVRSSHVRVEVRAACVHPCMRAASAHGTRLTRPTLQLHTAHATR